MLAVAAVTALALYHETLGYGFDYDDYHFVRPYSRGEVQAAFHGPWDATGIEVPFYRPLTVAFFAARFELFGINSEAYHALSVGLAALAAALAGWLAWRLSRRFAAGLLATLLFIGHPALPYSLVAWVTNQMHAIEIAVVLAAFAWWHAVRGRPVAWWTPLLAFGAAAFLIKEDGVMLLPAIIVVHTAITWIDRKNASQVPAAFVGLTALLLGALVLARREFLHGLGGYHPPTPVAAWNNLTRGLIGVFSLRPPDRPWQPLASWMALLLPILAMALWRRTTTGTRQIFVAGACIALLFDLPFLFVSKAEQMHIVALGAVLVLTASVLAIGEAFPHRGSRAAAAAIAAVTIGAFAAVARDISQDFDPFGPVVRAHDRLVTGWAAVPVDMRAYLERKLSAGARVPANPAEAVPVVAFNMHLPETSAAGVRFRWMASADVDLEVTRAAHEITIPLRHEIGAFREPAHVVICADGRRVDELTLRDDVWHVSQFGVRPADVRRLRRTHRIQVHLDRAWQPRRLIPGSRDGRTLGLQVGEIEVRR